MSLDPDVLVDRRRLRRRLSLWRAVAFVAVLAVVVIAGLWAGGVPGLGEKSSPHVARVSIDGFISGDRRTLEMIRDVAKNPNVKGVVIAIDSPGGATTGGEALYEELRKMAQAKPTVAAIGGIGASAGYMVALAADHVVARRNAITGSIGVIMQWGDVSKLLETVGVRYQEVKSAPLKAEPQPFRAPSPEATAMLQGMVRDSYDWFVGLVAERRKMTDAAARTVADGRVVTGHQALELKLIDAIGGEDVAIRWLEAERGVAKDLPVRDWKPRPVNSEDWGFAKALVQSALQGLGLEGVWPARVQLDGLVSVWHGRMTENYKNGQGVGQ